MTLCVPHRGPECELFISKGERKAEAENISQDKKDQCLL